MLGHRSCSPSVSIGRHNIERTVEQRPQALHLWDREEFIAACRKEIEGIGTGLLELAVRVGLSADSSNL